MPKPKNPDNPAARRPKTVGSDNPRARRPRTMAEMRELIDEFWASIAEERRLRAEGEKRREEADRRREEAEAKRDAEAQRREAEAKAEAERRAEYVARSEKEMAELRRGLASVNKSTGDFARNTGRILERDVMAKIKRDRGIGPVKGKVYEGLKKEGEYDGAVINGREAVVLEIKRNLRLDDVRKFLDKRIPRFVRDFPDLTDGRKVYGAVAFQLDADDGKAVALARENGLMLVRINSRRRIEVLNPDTAQLRNIAG